VSEPLRKQILLVEDEAILAMTEKVQLEKYGYAVRTVTSGEKAVDAVKTSSDIDLILMDINLGDGIDGTQAAEQILNHQDIPVVFLSSHTEHEIVEKTEKISSYGYVVKNSSVTVLDASIKMALKLFDAKTAHRLKEVALQESEKRFYELFERAPLGYQSLDSHGRFLEVNKAWLETLGYSRNEVIGKWFGDFLSPEYLQPFRERFPLFLAQGRIHSEFYMLHKNGTRVYIAFDGRVGLNEDGSFKQTHCILKDETERKQSEEALRESEERFKRMVNEAPLGIAVVDSLNAEFRLVNPALSRITGRSIEELERIDWVNITHPDDVQPDKDNMAALNAGQITGFQMEKRYLHADGHYLWVNITVAPMHVVDKARPLHLLMVEDVSDRKLAEEEIRRFKTISDNAIHGHAIADLQGNILYINRFFATIHGYEPEELIGKHFSLFHNEHQMDTANSLIAAMIQEGYFAPTTVWHCHRDGTEFPMLMSGILLKDEDGNPQYISTSVVDITDHQRVEETLRTTIHELKKSQVVAKVGSWVWLIPQNRVEWSDEMYRIFGIDKEMFSGDLTRIINDCIHPDDRAEVNRSTASVMDQNTPIPVEYRILRPDGSVRTVWAEAGELELDGAGEPVLLRGIVHDITKRKQAEQEVQKQLSEKEILLREVHHRVKNNIANIESLLSLQAASTANAEVKATLQDAITRVQSMRVLYDKLLLSKDLHEVSMKNYTEGLIDSLVMFFDPKNNVRIEKRVTDFEIDAKKAFLVGIIVNELLTNVFKYAFKELGTGTGTGTVSISIEKEQAKVTLIIQDDGVGFDERTMQNKSPGFGLTIVKMLVEQFGGTYSSVNDNGARSVVQFEL